MQAEEMHRIEDELIDPETGEIMERNLTDITVEELPKILRSLRSIKRQQTMIETYFRDEVVRLDALCCRKIDTLTSRESYLNHLAQGLLVKSGQKRLEYPGLGVVRFGTTRESVNTEKWDALTPDEKRARKDTMFTCLTIKETIAPNKPEIMKQIKNGVSDVCDLFHINEKQETFIFKAEE